MRQIDFIIITQSEVVNYSKYSELPLDRLPLYKELIYPRMVYYKNGFRSHLDLINGLGAGVFWEDASPAHRRNLMSIWNLAGFTGIYLANYLQQFGLTTYVVNNIDAEWDTFCEVYKNCTSKPLVSISTTFHINYTEIGRVAKKLHGNFPDMSIVLGGAFINNQMQLDCADELSNAMKKYGIDFVLHGFNSELDLRDLLLWYQRKEGTLDCINNLAYKSISNGSTAVTFTKTVWNQSVLDSVVPSHNNLELPFLNTTVQMRTSIGCPFSCEFCSYPALARGFHLAPIEIIEQNIQTMLARQNINKIIFVDDTFNVPVQRFKELCTMFSKYDFEWFSFLRVQYVTDEIAQLIKESGCRGVYLGIESANDGILSNMNKKVTRNEYIKGINSLHKNNITTMAAFVLGFPGETASTIRDNVSFIEDMAFDFYTLKEFYYMENTPVYQNREKYQLTGIGNKWSHSTMDSATTYDYKISMFKEIKNSVFIDPDTSLWYIAYLYDQGFSIDDISVMQKYINTLMRCQLEGDFNDMNPAYDGIREIARKRFNNYE